MRPHRSCGIERFRAGPCPAEHPVMHSHVRLEPSFPKRPCRRVRARTRGCFCARRRRSGALCPEQSGRGSCWCAGDDGQRGKGRRTGGPVEESAELPVMELGRPGPERDQGIAAIRSGTKTALTGLLEILQHEGEPVPRTRAAVPAHRLRRQAGARHRADRSRRGAGQRGRRWLRARGRPRVRGRRRLARRARGTVHQPRGDRVPRLHPRDPRRDAGRDRAVPGGRR